MLADFRHAVRLLGRSPGFTVAMVAVLALGIGANTAVFSIVRAVLLRPLPYYEPDRIVFLWRSPHRSVEGHGIMTGAHVHQVIARNTTLSSVAVMKVWSSLHTPIDLFQDDSAERLRGLLATPNFFELLGVRAALGRTFLPSDHEAEPVVVLSDSVWRRAFGAEPGVVGRRVLLRATRDRRGWISHLVVGVLPPAFRHTYPEDTEIYGLLPWSAIRAGSRSLEFSMIGRLEPGASVADAGTELTAVARDVARSYVLPPQIREEIIKREAIVVESVGEHFASDVRPGVLLLGAMAALVLLIACVNMALLVLARAADRGREFAMRSALGAVPRRLLRQLAVEGIALAALGGVTGVAAAAAGMPLLRRLVPPVVPRADEIGIDGQVLAFALAATGLTAAACGLAPAWLTLGRRMQSALRQSGASTASRAVSRARQAVVGLQVAVVLLLLAGGALLLHSFWRLHGVDLGFDGRGVIAMEMRLLNPKYRQPGRIAAFERELLDRVRALPGVERASMTTSVPLSGGVNFTMVVGPRGGRPRAGEMRSVDPDYFAIMRIPLRAGRLPNAGDTATAPAVMVVSESYGRAHFGNLNPLGRTLEFDGGPREIVGVVGDVRSAGVTREPPPAFYVPRAQQSNELICLVARAAPGMQAAVTAGIRQTIGSLDPEQPVQHVTTVDAIVARAMSEKRFYALATGAFAAIALALAVAGLAGVVSRSVSERRREIAIRVALGADRASLLRLVFAYGLTPVVFGLLAGLWTSVSSAAILQTFLFDVDAADPVTLATVSLLLFAVACAACYMPARRAIGVEPMAALKSD